MTNQEKQPPVTNAERARQFVVDHFTCERCLSKACPRCCAAIEKMERLLNEADDRGREEGEALVASRRAGQPDKATVDALLDAVRDGIAVLGVDVATADGRARSIVQGLIGNFEVRLLDEVTEPGRGRAGS